MPSVFATSDDESSEDPFGMFMPPLFVRDPSFSFFNRARPINPFASSRPSVFPTRSPSPTHPTQSEVPSGYTKLNETRFVVSGREFCQTVYEKVEDKEFGMFTSRIITAQPCDQIKKDGAQEPAAGEQPEGDKKDSDRRFAKPEVERENEPKPNTPDSSSSSVAPEVNQSSTDKPEVKVTSESEQADTKPSASDSKPEKSNEIPDKASEPTRPEPSITVNDK
jgi:hypothetical protein